VEYVAATGDGRVPSLIIVQLGSDDFELRVGLPGAGKHGADLARAVERADRCADPVSAAKQRHDAVDADKSATAGDKDKIGAHAALDVGDGSAVAETFLLPLKSVFYRRGIVDWNRGVKLFPKRVELGAVDTSYGWTR
jgi:hypothetical protein